jgi:hypothetical protein
MPNQTRIVSPGVDGRSVRTTTGQILHPPQDWELLPPGDATLTRRVKAAGPTWTIQERKGRKLFSRGVWAPAQQIAAVKKELEAERATPAYAKRRTAEVTRREQKQVVYVEDFGQAVLEFLDFSPRYAKLAAELTAAVTKHATPVGSGTVARTQRIPLERRAEAAVIAWLRHQTTDYDELRIARVKGKRREVRRQLAEQSRRLLAIYRQGGSTGNQPCLLQRALAGVTQKLQSDG